MQNVVNQVSVAASSSAAGASLEDEPADEDLADELAAELGLDDAADDDDAAGAAVLDPAVVLPELQPVSSRPPAANRPTIDERFMSSPSFRVRHRDPAPIVPTRRPGRPTSRL